MGNRTSLSAAMELERRYLFGNAVDQVLAQENIDETTSSAARVHWHLTNNLGTVRDLAKNDGTAGEHYEYDAYGNVLDGDTSLTHYLFTSREYNEDIDLQSSIQSGALVRSSGWTMDFRRSYRVRGG